MLLKADPDHGKIQFKRFKIAVALVLASAFAMLACPTLHAQHMPDANTFRASLISSPYVFYGDSDLKADSSRGAVLTLAPAPPSTLELVGFRPTSALAIAPRDFSRYSLPNAAGAPFPNAVPSPGSARSGRGKWLALGIGGVAVAGIGGVAYAIGHDSSNGCAAPTGRTCNDLSKAGEIMIPIGAVMAVTGFVMRFR
jgi:hypothetical protein